MMRHLRCLCLLIALACLLTAAHADAAKPAPFVDGSWTLVLLPDPQIYSRDHPNIFKSQTQWIVNNAAARNIKFVMTEGDDTNDNVPNQWENAKAAMSLLDGKVPYAIVTGNHDYRGKDLGKRASLVNAYFPPESLQKSPYYGGVYEKGKIDNAYYLFSAGGRDWVALSLEYYPRDGVIAWANKVLDAYPKRSAIICTHAYLYCDNTRFNKKGNPKQPKLPSGKVKSGLNDGEEMWQKLLSKHANVQFVFCGHVTHSGVGYLLSKGDSGNEVHQVLANYQMRKQGGEGYLRLVEFQPDGKTVQIKTYSPYLDKYMTDPTQQFKLSLSPTP